MITDRFTLAGSPVEIVLAMRTDSDPTGIGRAAMAAGLAEGDEVKVREPQCFALFARYEGGGRVNGFEMRIDNIGHRKPEDVYDHPTVVHLRNIVQQLALTDAWPAYESRA